VGPAKKTGVRSCSSFSWAMPPECIWERLTLNTPCACGEGHVCPLQETPDILAVIEDEYGGLYTLDMFKAVLEECPVQFMERLGQWFS